MLCFFPLKPLRNLDFSKQAVYHSFTSITWKKILDREPKELVWQKNFVVYILQSDQGFFILIYAFL